MLWREETEANDRGLFNERSKRRDKKQVAGKFDPPLVLLHVIGRNQTSMC